MQRGLGPVLARITAVIAGLLLLGLILRLIGAVLSPVLPSTLWAWLIGGWDLLFSLLGPAMVPIMALVVLAAVCWVVGARHR